MCPLFNALVIHVSEVLPGPQITAPYTNTTFIKPSPIPKVKVTKGPKKPDHERNRWHGFDPAQFCKVNKGTG